MSNKANILRIFRVNNGINNAQMQTALNYLEVQKEHAWLNITVITRYMTQSEQCNYDSSKLSRALFSVTLH